MRTLKALLRAAAVALGLFPFSAAAQQVSLPEALAAIEQYNPDLAVVRLLQPLAAADVIAARAYPNPEIELGSGWWRSRAGIAPGSATLAGVSQTLELPSVRAGRIGAAEAGIAVAGHSIRAARAQMGFAGRAAFYDMLRRQEEEGLAAQAAALLQEVRVRVAARVNAGEAPRLELIRADAEALAARTAHAAAGLRLDEARAALRRLAGNALPARFEAAGGLPPADLGEALSGLQASMLDGHPTLRVLEAERERARKRLEEERALRYPAPTVRAAQSRDPEMRQMLIGVSLPLPLWNRREGQIARAEVAIEAAQAQIGAQRVQLLRELDSAFARAAVARSQIDTYEAGLLRSAQAALDAAQVAYRAGERGFIEVLDAQRTLRLVRNDYVGARYELQSARLDLARLAGRDPFHPEWQ